MSGIKDSDSIPSPSDKANAEEMFRDQSGEIDLIKVAHTVSRLHRKESVQHTAVKELAEAKERHEEAIKAHKQEFNTHKESTETKLNDIMVCLKGDAMGMSKGLVEDHKDVKSMMTEVYEKVTNKDATTHKTKRSEPQDDQFWNNTKIILLFLGKVCVGLFAFAGLIVAILELLK